MDLDMYQHPSTLNSFQKLADFGNIMIPAERGELASGLHGEGRMAEPENIVIFLETFFEKKMPLRGKKILITAGPTYEAIDPVRYIGNHASGKMGFELAQKAADFGATVFLISGPTHCTTHHPKIHLVPVVTAEEMYKACHHYFNQADWVIAAAAVADYRPINVASEKIKKDDSTLVLNLEKTPDILASLGAVKKHQTLVGFALETENELENAMLKIHKKNLDLVVLNSLRDTGAGFGFATNKVTFIDKQMNVTKMELKSKEEVAQDILLKVLTL
jgi:phosphopantothenoylcysteine decarboxylase/phosphopantothenate--cysteine ligase